MSIVPFLICFPFLVSILMYITRVNKVRNMIAYVCSGIIVIADGVFVAQWIASGCKPKWLYYETELIDHLIIGAVWILAGVVTYFCVKYKRYAISLLRMYISLSSQRKRWTLSVKQALSVRIIIRSAMLHIG